MEESHQDMDSNEEPTMGLKIRGITSSSSSNKKSFVHDFTNDLGSSEEGEVADLDSSKRLNERKGNSSLQNNSKHDNVKNDPRRRNDDMDYEVQKQEPSMNNKKGSEHRLPPKPQIDNYKPSGKSQSQDDGPNSRDRNETSIRGNSFYYYCYYFLSLLFFFSFSFFPLIFTIFFLNQ